MAQLDFFALDEDFYSLMQFVFVETDMIIFEAYSRIDREIRQIMSVEHLRDIADERRAGGFLLRGWFPEAMDTPSFRTYRLNPEVGKHRTSVEGAGVVQFSQGVIDLGYLKFSSFSHWNEAGAIQRGVLGAENVNWVALRRHSGRVHRHVRHKLSVAKASTASVLPQAFSAVGDGLSLWYGKEYKLDSLELREA